MNGYCTQCRAPLGPGATFCTNCGTPVAPAGPPPGYGGAPGGYGPPQPPGPYGGQPGPYGGGAPPPGPYGGGAPPPGPYGGGAPPPGYGSPGGYPPPAPPPVVAPPPPPPPPAPSGGAGTGVKVLGGCGLAGCIGAVVAVIGGVALVIVLALLAGSSSSGSGSSSGSSGSESGGQGRSEVPGDGSLRSIVPQHVGSYRLVGTAPVTKLGELLQGGVVDSLGAVYTAPDGTQLTQILLVYASEAIAADKMNDVFRVGVQATGPGERVKRGNVLDRSGGVIGSRVEISGGNPQHVYWSNRKLLTFVTAAPPHATTFEDGVPY